MTINKNEDFRSQFNSDWAGKQIIAVDEVLLDKKEDSERIKNLSTARTYKTESKGIDKSETGFYGKFILCSNNVDNFIMIDENEIRYWVIDVPSFDSKSEKPDLLESLKKELPHFMYFLNKRQVKSPKLTRMWFTKDQIYTKALQRLVKGNKTYLNRELEEILIEDFIKFEVEILKYSLGDLLEKLSKNNIRTTSFNLRNVITNYFKIDSFNGSYTKYYQACHVDGNYIVNDTKHKGRYYTFRKENFIKE